MKDIELIIVMNNKLIDLFILFIYLLFGWNQESLDAHYLVIW